MDEGSVVPVGEYELVIGADPDPQELAVDEMMAPRAEADQMFEVGLAAS